MHLKTVMLKANLIMRNDTGKRYWRFSTAHAVAMTLVIVAALFMATACQQRPVMAHAKFIHLPVGGWQRNLPLTFVPEYDDSAAVYELKLAVRHDISYPYRDLLLVVDVIAEDSTVNRRTLDLPLSDEYGNWTGGGFGSLYQNQVTLSTGVKPEQASTVIVWQVMSEKLTGVDEIGVLASPM